MSDDVSRPEVTFAPSGASIRARYGVTLLEAAAEAGVVIPAPCGGRGACGRCAVTVLKGALAPPSDRETAALARARRDASRLRLACMARVAGPVTVRPLVSHAPSPSASGLPGGGRRIVAGVDLGTTSVAVHLVDATDLMLVGRSRTLNRQAIFGADVLSRVSAALGGSSGELRELAETSVLEALGVAAGRAQVALSDIGRIVVAGNTAMISLLAGVPVAGLATHPFTHELPERHVITNPRFAESVPAAEVLAVPAVAAFVGGDLVAGVLAEGLVEGARPTLFVDLGTNAEIAAIIGDRAVVSSAAAGPAFEGWGISCGGQAGAGGIVRIASAHDGDLRPVTDGDPATHLTGSGLISAIAFLRRSGHLGPDGLLTAAGPASHRFFEVDGVRAVSVGSDPDDRSIYLTQLDVRALQSAKAAVCVALRSVVAHAGIAVDALDATVVTGAFGGGVDPADLVDLGIVPSQAAGSFRLSPDGAVRGAARMALEPELLDAASGFAARAAHVDLAADTSFTEDFVACLALERFELVDGSA